MVNCLKNVNAIDTSELSNKTDYNAKIEDIEDKIPSIFNLATPAALSAFEDKILKVSTLVNKADYDVKISDREKKYFTTSDYNKLTKDVLDAKITNKELADKSDISGFINNSD